MPPSRAARTAGRQAFSDPAEVILGTAPKGHGILLVTKPTVSQGPACVLSTLQTLCPLATKMPPWIDKKTETQ
jgi:hypothetical protein